MEELDGRELRRGREKRNGGFRIRKYHLRTDSGLHDQLHQLVNVWAPLIQVLQGVLEGGA